MNEFDGSMGSYESQLHINMVQIPTITGGEERFEPCVSPIEEKKLPIGHMGISFIFLIHISFVNFQKYGLRDISKRKTPEATIVDALLRDANLFERVFPSTYSVRPSFRKYMCNAEVVLQAAKEKIQLFQSGFTNSKELIRIQRMSKK